MKQTYSEGENPSSSEVTIMTVWPSISSTWRGRALGRGYLNQAGRGILPFGLTMGKVWAFISIPLVLPLILGPLGAELASGLLRSLGNVSGPLRPLFHGLARANDGLANFLVGLCYRYRLTNQRVLVERPLQQIEERSVSLTRFDQVEVVVQPGQEWYPAGDLVFKQGAVETFRLEGVRHPETFRRTCLNAQRAHAGVAKAREASVAAG